MYEYAPIAKALHKLHDTATAHMKCMLDITYFIAKQNMAFAKMGPLYKLEERHGVDLRTYENQNSKNSKRYVLGTRELYCCIIEQKASNP